jgi:DNA polymerase
MHEPLPLRTVATDAAIAARIDYRDRHVLHRDYEARSRLVLKSVGTHRYAADASTEILCCAYTVDDQPVQLWIPGNPVPPEFIEAANNPNWIVAAHGDHFESAIERHVMVPRFGWSEIPLERHVCTMAMAAAVGLPARLSAAAGVLELNNRKDAAGERLMHQMSKPRKARKGEAPGIYWFDDPDRLRRLYIYCRQDVEVERELYDRLPALSAAEQALWVLSCTINQRGFCIDRKFAEAARRIAQAASPEIDAELVKITNGTVTGINQIARLQTWLKQHGTWRRAWIAKPSSGSSRMTISPRKCSACSSSDWAARKALLRRSMRC